MFHFLFLYEIVSKLRTNLCSLLWLFSDAFPLNFAVEVYTRPRLIRGMLYEHFSEETVADQTRLLIQQSSSHDRTPEAQCR